MAAVSDSPLARIVDLRHLRPGDLDPLLDEETEVWRDTLDWDFRGSAGLVRRFLDMQALNGYSLVMNGHPVGYCYFVSEERKGLIGDLYVMKEFVTVENEERLLSRRGGRPGKDDVRPAHRVAVDDAAQRRGHELAAAALCARAWPEFYGGRFGDGRQVARGPSGSPGFDR